MIRSCRDKDAQRPLERKFSRRLQAIESPPASGWNHNNARDVWLISPELCLFDIEVLQDDSDDGAHDNSGMAPANFCCKPNCSWISSRCQ